MELNPQPEKHQLRHRLRSLPHPHPRHRPKEACHSTSCWSCLRRARWCRAAGKMSSTAGLPSKIPGREYRASMKNCASRRDPTQACSHHFSIRPRASAMAQKKGSQSLLLRLILPRAGSRFQRSLLRQRAQGKQWSMCGEDLIRDADHTQVSANPPSRNCFARSSATLVSQRLSVHLRPRRRGILICDATPVRRQLPPLPNNNLIQPAGVLAERLP